ncbi:MAG: hypothetical protein A2579_01920 [Lysobacterales bacterium RIFOXYD1_FULL_69_11]|nr:MAG: hypothetical protein A2579_01920 [Xanthomonadales bacterium RIFOXYD1_FULL_69_11]
MSIALLVLALPGGCERPPLPGSQSPPAAAPPVTTRGPDDAALTTADVTRPGNAPVADTAPESEWRRALAQGVDATLTLPANTGSGELPAEAAKQLDALARLLDAERDWRLTISVEEAPAASTPSTSPSSLQQAQAFRLALLSRGVAAGRVLAEPASRPHPAPPAGTVRVRLRRLPPTDRPIPAPRRWS